MLRSFLLACGDALAPAQRRLLVRGILIAIAALALVWGVAGILLHEVRLFDSAWLDTPLEILGDLAVVLLSWLLFPATLTLVLSCFLDGMLRGLEREHYPWLPPARRVSVVETLGALAGLVALQIAANLAALPFYLVPGMNFFVYLALNGYLVGREYFLLVALRRLDRRARRSMWGRYRFRFIFAGVVVAFLMSLPFLNLAVPLVATAFMLHLFEGLRGGSRERRRVA